MKLDRTVAPKTRNSSLDALFKKALKAAESILSGKSTEDKGPFGEPIELLSYQLAKKAGSDLSAFAKALQIDNRLSLIFRDFIEDKVPEAILEGLILGTYGFILGHYDDEDFRYLYRYTLSESDKDHIYSDWMKRSISLIAALDHVAAEDIMHEIRYWLSFLGAPLYLPSDFTEHCMVFDVDIEPILNNDDIRVVLSLRAHPEYLKEAVQGRPFDDLYNATKEWAPDVLLSDLFKISEARMYKELDAKISDEMNVEKAIEVSQKEFKKSGFQVDKETPIPVKLQKLENPPPPEAINPVIFEMIPQKLRMHLMTSVAYSTTPKEVEIIFLGGQKIGRSGILIKTATGGILLDYGLSVANQTIPEWIPELETIDTILVSHSHLDHIGGLPILFDRFEGRWCSTGTTGAITMALLDDALKVGTPLPPRKHDKLDRISKFDEENVEKVSKNHVKLEVGDTSEVAPGILVTPVDACHIPGSVAYLVDIEGFKILYTGDFNLDQSVLFPGASFPVDPNVVIFDGTYWGREDFNRAMVTEQLSTVIEKNGPVIIPSFAVGRSQEILSILDKIGVTNTHNVMVAGMAEKVTKMVGISGKWEGMKKNKTELEKDDVLVAGGGMMGGGLAKYHFQQHRDNKEAAVILCGYLAPRTTGWNLLHGYEPHKCHLEYARLSAHSSASKLEEYVGSCKGKKVMVHTPTLEQPKQLIIPEVAQRLKFKV
ncbi:MAG: MBL fold metallo-hydrolase [Candidatus Thorarchaeota archaeon]